jgi:predicted transposase YdaD
MKSKTESKAYDKILKENVGKFFLSLSQKYLGIAIQKSEELKDKLQTTLEKEADFLRIIHTPTGEKFVLHLEFQTADEKDMLYRMQEYFAILQKKYKLPIKQFVIYLGETEPQMRTELRDEEIFRGFELKNLHQFDYETMLNSDIPKEIMLAILCDFKQEEAEEVLGKIITRLKTLSRNQINLQKYIRQFMVLARLRNLSALTSKQLKDMALVYDIEQDALYKEGKQQGEQLGLQKGEQLGLQKGEQLGLQKGELRKTIKGIQKALAQKVLTLEQIADLFEVSVDFVVKVQKGEVQ